MVRRTDWGQAIRETEKEQERKKYRNRQTNNTKERQTD